MQTHWYWEIELAVLFLVRVVFFVYVFVSTHSHLPWFASVPRPVERPDFSVSSRNQNCAGTERTKLLTSRCQRLSNCLAARFRCLRLGTLVVVPNWKTNTSFYYNSFKDFVALFFNRFQFLCKPFSFTGYFDTECIWFSAGTNPEISIWTSTVVMQVWNVERLSVQYANVSAT